ncbi:DUF2271 domain-containing protein [Methylobacterium sp. DB0501]|jgi:hypothetical protein|uniref:DUF2271 domain-containing protein n=1 Tax=Methylobacterium currus TaxID=2051553 RepID=UPI0012ED9C50|nr:DUF2271 domain-containing protein [Methylobacterium currus]NGM37367.1 DUF2271 domain-containing protein [Methylobacterium sp. DB0501]UHC20278.1 DUF2271 domain-containing protein [Methylobacterium currus]
MPEVRPLRSSVTALFSALLTAPTGASELTVSVQIPRLEVAEYHRPYVAVWLERPDQSVAANLAVWYDIAKPGREGTKWLKDMRQWWRRVGRELEMPVDSVSGATRPVGEHALRFSADAAPLKDLAPGSYQIVVEAAREVGGREIVRLPLSWPAGEPGAKEVRGAEELGRVAVTLTP